MCFRQLGKDDKILILGIIMSAKVITAIVRLILMLSAMVFFNSGCVEETNPTSNGGTSGPPRNSNRKDDTSNAPKNSNKKNDTLKVPPKTPDEPPPVREMKVPSTADVFVESETTVADIQKMFENLNFVEAEPRSPTKKVEYRWSGAQKGNPILEEFINGSRTGAYPMHAGKNLGKKITYSATVDSYKFDGGGGGGSLIVYTQKKNGKEKITGFRIDDGGLYIVKK